MDFQIPPGLTELMQDFTFVALKERPADLVDFAADYFIKLRDSKKQYGISSSKVATKSRGVKFTAEESESDEDSSGEEPGKCDYSE